jgi:hypothetical protein
MLPYSARRPTRGTTIAVLCAIAAHAVVIGAVISGERGAAASARTSTAHTLDDPIGKASGLGGAATKKTATEYLDASQAEQLVGSYRLAGARGTLSLTISAVNERMAPGDSAYLVLWAEDSVRGRKRLVFEPDSGRFSYEFDSRQTLTFVVSADSTVATLGGREPPLTGVRVRKP